MQTRVKEGMKREVVDEEELKKIRRIKSPEKLCEEETGKSASISVTESQNG